MGKQIFKKTMDSSVSKQKKFTTVIAASTPFAYAFCKALDPPERLPTSSPSAKANVLPIVTQ